jgi:segregation and condensation protein B
MEENIQRNVSALESMLFVYGEALSEEKIMKILECDEEMYQIILSVLQKRYEDPISGLSLVRKNATLALVSRKENASCIQKFLKKDVTAPLSQALLEVLSIVAYRAPVTRQDIDAIRGVNSSGALRSLSIRGLVEREGGEDGDRSYRYKPSLLFFQVLGISDISQLPRFEELTSDSRLNNIQNENE